MAKRAHSRSFRTPFLAAMIMLALILAGAFAWFRPYLTEKRQTISEVPGPSALYAVAEFPLTSSGRVCMRSVGINSTSDTVEFHLRPAKVTPAGGSPVKLLLSAPGYRATVRVPGGYPGGGVDLPITPPKHPTIATACFVNLGKTTVLLDGTTEPRTISRSTTWINDRVATGDVALAFVDSQPRSLLSRLGEVFNHASNLTDDLIPTWLVWMIALITAFGVPVGMIVALYNGLREDERAEPR